MRLTESERIARIRERLEREHPGVVVGIGDDAAVLSALKAPVLSVDASVEGTHFRTDFAPWPVLARRAVVAAASDLAAMGARPRAILTALVLRPDLNDEDVDGLFDGIADAASEVGAPVVGGNLAAGNAVSITTTVVGDLDGAPLTRSGARVGDGVYVTGTVGDAALGLALLLAGRGDEPRAERFVARWRNPTAEFLAGEALRGRATAVIDVSDGLVQDLGHLCGEHLGAELNADELPLSSGFEALARELGLDPLGLALGGGEDYGLLFTAPADARVKQLATRIGLVMDRPGVRVLDSDGREVPVSSPGFDHFAPTR